MKTVCGSELQVGQWYWIRSKSDGRLRVRKIKEICERFIEVTENSSVNFFDAGAYDFIPLEEPEYWKNNPIEIPHWRTKTT